MLAASVSAMLWALSGGQLFSDDFESGALVKPTGRWDMVVAGGLPVLPQLDSAAAHRGDGGLSFSRQADGGVIGAYGGWLELALAPTVDGGSLTARVWMRERQSNDTSGLVFGQLLANNVSNGVVAEEGFVHGNEEWHLQGYDCSVASQSVVTSLGFDAGWHLAELELTGIGTVVGLRRLLIDGTLIAESSVLDLHSADVTTFRLGDVYLYNAVGDTLDLDDVRLDTASQAEAFWASTASAPAGVCTGVTVALTDWGGFGRPAPYTFQASVTSSPGLGVYLAAGCGGAQISQVPFPAGQIGRAVWVLAAAPGVYSVTLSYPDFLSRVVPFAVVGDGGFGDGGSDAGLDGGPDGGPNSADAGPLLPRFDRVDCGCSSAPALLPLVALLALRRRQLKS